MATKRIESTRIKRLNECPASTSGGYVLYWMQQSQRASFNPALEYAIECGNDLGVPVVVGFGLMAGYPEANRRHYEFLAQGLADAQRRLNRRGIRFIVRYADPDRLALDLGKHAAVIVADRGYLRHQKAWRQHVAEAANVEVVQVEGDVVVPVEQVSDKAEYAARTIRPKINRNREDYLTELRPRPVKHKSIADGAANDAGEGGESLDDLDALLKPLGLDQSVEPSPLFTGGQSQARAVFRRFLDQRFGQYTANRNQPQTSDTSYMSMYLHFGQVSPVWLALELRRRGTAGGGSSRGGGREREGSDDEREAYLEEMIVRRELAMNFCEFEPRYDQYAALPNWAKATLRDHRDDEREHVYSRYQLEESRTHDPYWNAAMAEMRHTGYMHNYMRMYWGKKILEWTNTPEHAFQSALVLNNKYFIDGRDANSYANVAWLFGLHDRPWTERKVLGKIRYMNANGLKRKADPDAYVDKVNRLIGSLR